MELSNGVKAVFAGLDRAGRKFGALAWTGGSGRTWITVFEKCESSGRVVLYDLCARSGNVCTAVIRFNVGGDDEARALYRKKVANTDVYTRIR